ncbi:MAG: class I SAM-dependent methyltransferase, partial [Verrucomicrobiota bacterium]
PTIRPTLANSYHLLSSGRVSKALAISSGVIDEAEFFGVQAKRLISPERRNTDFFYSKVSNLNLLRGEMLSALLLGNQLPKIRSGHFGIRNQLNISWGLDETPSKADFYSPPVATESGFAAHPDTQSAGESQEAMEAAGSNGLLPKIIRSPRTIYRLIRKSPQWIQYTIKKRYEETRARSSLQATDEESGKDFSYQSGERQIATYYYEVRRDHRLRYEFANSLLETGSKVLDAFCGNGYGSCLLSKTRTVTGLDGSKDAIQVARDHYNHFGASFVCEQFPCEFDNLYDAIVSFESIEHVENGPEFFKELVRNLRSGGVIIYSTPNEDLMPFDPSQHIHHTKHYTLAETLQLARGEGLEIITWLGQNVYELSNGKITDVLCQGQMNLDSEVAGQFTVVAARKL